MISYSSTATSVAASSSGGDSVLKNGAASRCAGCVRMRGAAISPVANGIANRTTTVAAKRIVAYL
jgi:hypothetical protein